VDIGSDSAQQLTLENPTASTITLVVDRVPGNLGFSVESTSIEVEPGKTSMCVSWKPKTAGNCKGSILFKFGARFRLQVTVFGSANAKVRWSAWHNLARTKVVVCSVFFTAKGCPGGQKEARVAAKQWVRSACSAAEADCRQIYCQGRDSQEGGSLVCGQQARLGNSACCKESTCFEASFCLNERQNVRGGTCCAERSSIKQREHCRDQGAG
jgi:hypothetical protein